jgi:hypothetical protein
VGIAQWQKAHRQVLGGGDFDLGAYLSYEERLGILTPNTITPYYVAFPDLSRTGPLCVYDALTRTLPDTPTKLAEIFSRSDPATNPDGGVELRFGPEPPSDSPPSNWIQTVGGRAFFVYLRLYAPTEPYFDRSWPLGDIQPT